ncbi:unnamed protein product [Lasius platythorax]|uniref:Uncharacterized protein n=1 Tax=Lasius platythorax TaxID=488582 RepID=A0AAV2NCN1_9HYME
MNRFFLFVLLICTVSTAYHPCVIKDKGKSDIRVIDIDDSSTDDSSSKSESDILTLHLPDREKKESGSQKGKGFCKRDEDCDAYSICLANIICVKGTRRNLDFLGRSAIN